VSTKKSRKLRIWIITGVVVIIAGLVVANVMIKKTPKGLRVDCAVAKADSLVQTVTASGKIQPKIEVNISAEVSGRILYMVIKEGDRVEKGQLLVQIDDETYKATLEQNRFSLASAEASLEETRSNLRRTRELHASHLASDAELEVMEATVKRLIAGVDQARANVGQAEEFLAKTRLYSPISGIVTRLNKEPGEMAIGANFTEDVIMVVSKLDQMEVNAEINENDVVLLNLGDPVSIEVFAMPDTSFRGVVSEIAHSGIIRGQGTAEEVTNFEVKVEVLDDVSHLRPGMSATVEIETDRRDNTLVLPQESIAVRALKKEHEAEERARSSSKGKKRKSDHSDKNGGNQNEFGEKPEELVEVVYVIENDTAWVRPVKLGIYSDTHFEILEGIEAEDLVVTGPFRVLSRELSSGARVSFDEPHQGEGESPGEVGDSTELASSEAATGENTE